MFCPFFKLARRSQAGFTLIELLVVISIFVITTGIVLGNLPAFRDKSALDLVAQELATIVRQAQVYGAGTRGAVGGQFPSYGIYLHGTGFGSAPANRVSSDLTLFEDKLAGSVNYYNGSVCPNGAASECVEKYTFSNGISIVDVQNCSGGTCATVFSATNGRYNIIFKRPTTDAKFFNAVGVAQSFEYVRITIKNQKGQCRNVKVWSTGHIYVDPDDLLCS